jgi:hypothetical protein
MKTFISLAALALVMETSAFAGDFWNRNSEDMAAFAEQPAATPAPAAESYTCTLTTNTFGTVYSGEGSTVGKAMAEATEMCLALEEVAAVCEARVTRLVCERN